MKDLDKLRVKAARYESNLMMSAFSFAEIEGLRYPYIYTGYQLFTLLIYYLTNLFYEESLFKLMTKN